MFIPSPASLISFACLCHGGWVAADVDQWNASMSFAEPGRFFAGSGWEKQKPVGSPAQITVSGVSVFVMHLRSCKLLLPRAPSYWSPHLPSSVWEWRCCQCFAVNHHLRPAALPSRRRLQKINLFSSSIFFFFPPYTSTLSRTLLWHAPPPP